MKPIENVNLAELVTEAAFLEIQAQKSDYTSVIRSILKRQLALAESVKHQRNQLNKAEEKLKSVQAKLEKLKEGDWTVLTELVKITKEKQDGNEPAQAE